MNYLNLLKELLELINEYRSCIAEGKLPSVYKLRVYFNKTIRYENENLITIEQMENLHDKIILIESVVF